MTVLCATTVGLRGIRPCTHFGLHRVTCPDHPGWAETLRPGTCRGCLPRQADRGFLCQRCYELVESACLRWPRWLRLVLAADGRLVAPEGGGQADGYSNLQVTTLAIDECTRLLASRADRTVDLWVHDEAGAADAIRFAHAAHNAFDALQTEERPKHIERVRCPGCGFLTLTENPTREHRGKTIIECQQCGHVLDEIRLPSAPRWFGSEDCESDDHLDCRGLECRCACHMVGRASLPQGIHAVFDADQHTTGYVDRSVWVITAGVVHYEPIEERRTA